MRYEVVPATAAHASELARRMRCADRVEVWASHRTTPRQAVAQSMRMSRDTYAGLADGRVVCLFGVARATALSNDGMPWMLATPLLRKHAFAFLRRNRQVVNKWRAEYATLANYVDARNTLTLRWLAWLGFTIEPAAPYGAEQLPFHRFSAGPK